MTLMLYNTLTKRKEQFHPIDPADIRVYVCGPTVYDLAHVGNARPIIVFDMLIRLLHHLYGAEHVTYVRNITDIDDKINARAAKEGISIHVLTECTTHRFHEDMDRLSCLKPTHEPRATAFIEPMKKIVERLVERGHAYVAEDHVLFDVASDQHYGMLSRRSPDEMKAGARVEIAPYKRGPLDFVLWKPSRDGEPSWPSPCAIAVNGRPGWHLECSAMAWTYLGERFDIHGAGLDLQFPHHENERAQSCCAFGTERMANLWMHNGLVTVGGKKMAKSSGNFVTIREFLQDWPGEVLRLTMLKTHYRQPLDWTLKGLQESHRILRKWRAVAERTESAACVSDTVIEALSDDLNTPKAIFALHALYDAEDCSGLRGGLQFLGLSGQSTPMARGLPTDINALIAQRAAARARKDFASADTIRATLAERGILLKDTAEGTVWQLAE
ncbi:MAG: cysteine--tRNA ligase [Hyphomicrobiales bacterium]